MEISLATELFPPRTNDPINIISEHLHRSQNSPLDISAADWSSASLDRSNEPVILLLLSHCERWQRFMIGTVAVDTLAAFRTIKGRLPLLEYLSLTIAQDSSATPLNDSVLNIFEVAPRLRKVSIMGRSCTREFVLPFPQLLHYETSSPTVSLFSLTQLRSLSLTSIEVPSTLTDSVETSSLHATHSPVTFHELSKLIIKTASSHNSSLLRSIRLPSIRTICVNSGSQAICRDLTFILSRTMSPCLLTRLDLKTLIDASDLPALLSVTTSPTSSDYQR
ncbi:hypothetical protein BDN70DRAFT_538943 [Pholiota conissans]|uniref:Uncharacterized protein n=1 Tax=Pholiota conissans TaxID=109636 RepID=A0A9P5ZGZ3_9AGAR|nr:hypothetical protein BDN70DRAFT_538943 [Pholiota conissans]